MLVHSLWDQEDSYGALAVYSAIKPKDTRGDMVKLVMGPWYHGQEIEEGSALGAIRFGSDTAQYFREQVLRPFLAQYLKDGAPKADVAPVTAFETGTQSVAPPRPLARRVAKAVVRRRVGLVPASRIRNFEFTAAVRTGQPMPSTFPIPRIPYPSAPGRSSRWDTTLGRPGSSGWSMISAKPRAVPMCSPSLAMC